MIGLFGGCEAKSTEDPINFEYYSCNEELKNNQFEPVDFYVVKNKYLKDQYKGFQTPTVQVDDKYPIKLGHTTLGEVYEMFTGITVEEQIKTARADDEGRLDKLPEEIEAEKKLNTKVPAETYSFYLKFKNKDVRKYAPIYLVSSKLVSQIAIQVYKYGEPYVEFLISSNYAKNKGIKQESDLVITGLSISKCTSKNTDEKDELHLIAKQNTWINGGFAFDGDNYEFTTLPSVFESWGIENKSEYFDGSKYYTITEDENFFYYADLYCFEPHYLDDIVYLSKSVIKYTIDRDTQKIISLSVWLENVEELSAEEYKITQDLPQEIKPED
jgi:hypothetical protein